MFGVLGRHLAIDLLVKWLIRGYHITTGILIEYGVDHRRLRAVLLAALYIAHIEEHVHPWDRIHLGENDQNLLSVPLGALIRLIDSDLPGRLTPELLQGSFAIRHEPDIYPGLPRETGFLHLYRTSIRELHHPEGKAIFVRVEPVAPFRIVHEAQSTMNNISTIIRTISPGNVRRHPHSELHLHMLLHLPLDDLPLLPISIGSV